MSNDISTEVKSLKEIVSEKVKAQFASLIPDDMWEKMVEKEIDALTKDYGTPGNYQYKQAELSTLIQHELKELAREAVKKELQKDEWKSKWVNEQNITGKAVEELITKNADKVIASMVSTMVQAMLTNAQYRIS